MGFEGYSAKMESVGLKRTPSKRSGATKNIQKLINKGQK